MSSDNNTFIDLSEYERIIAYKSLTDSTYLNSIADYVKPEYFEQPNIAKYFEIVKDFYDKRQKLPTITEIKPYLITDGLKNDFKKLIESFKDIDKEFNKEELYENTERFLKEIATWCNILDIAENSEKKVKNPSEVLDAFENICKICLDTERGIELFEDVDKINDDILNEEVYISSGWEWLDEHLGGGYRQDGKALYVFAGQANIGKSIFLGNVAANIAEQGKNVLVISLEMSEMLYAKRIASNVTKIPLKNFKDDAHTLRYALKEEGKTSGKLFIKEFPPSTITPKQLSAFIKKLIDTGVHLDAIVIDYLSLLYTDRGSNSYERIMYICEQIRAMSYIFRCPVISAIQLGRQEFGKENPGMEGIAGSIGVAATADVILSIFQSEEDMEMGLIKLGMMKNRFGPRGMVQAMKIIYETLTIIQSDEAEECMDGDDLSLLEKLAKQ
ncbi:MAG: DnaB-like helicase C-terminal domain-containing protein [Methanobacterium sp.]